MKSFAIVVICYNRLNSLKRLISSLESVDYDNRKDISLIFSIDKSDNSSVLNFATNYMWKNGEKKIRTFSEKQGLRKHVLSCGEFTSEFDIICVLEDDIYVSDSMYHFAYQASNFYEYDTQIAGISLYSFQKNWLNWGLRFEPIKDSYDVYFMRIAQSWGQVWTKSKWNEFLEWYSKNSKFNKCINIPEPLNLWPDSSWLKYHIRYCIENDKYFVYPNISLSSNFSDVGEHATENSNDHQVELQTNKNSFKFIDFKKSEFKYDEYMNVIGLGKYLGVDEDDLCVDIWGTRNYIDKKYILTSRKLNFEIVKMFKICLRPIELSVIKNIEGNDIKLYNTITPVKNNQKYNYKYNLFEYSTRSSDGFYLIKYSFIAFINEFKRKQKRLLVRVIKKLKKVGNV